MTTKTKTPHQLLKEVFKGYASRSWNGMRAELMRAHQYNEQEANDLIWFWITYGMIWGNQIEDDHFRVPSKKERNEKS